MSERILIVEDEETLRRNLARFLAKDGCEIDAFATAEEALESAEEKEYSVALLDVRLPRKDGITLTSELLARWPDMAVVLMTAYASVESVIDAMHAGALDYLLKPVLMKEVARKIERACEHRRLLRENARLRQKLAAIEKPEIVARSSATVELVALVRQMAQGSRPVLIQGESGSGKEVMARLLHDASPHAGGPFVAVSTTAIAEPMIESCLFGREDLSGHGERREGLFRAASGGTLFLDDIGDMPLAHQAKLLRAIEACEVLPVGSDRPVVVDARIVAASSVDLSALVRDKRFRADLYFRLSALRIDVPPLRSRPDDIVPLVKHFIALCSRQQGRPAISLDAAAEQKLLSYGWPGNVRELGNVIERAVLCSSGPEITTLDLPPETFGSPGEPEGGYAQAMEGFERALLRSTLERASGDRRAAAEALHLPLATLYRRIDKLGLKEASGLRTDEVPKASPSTK